MDDARAKRTPPRRRASRKAASGAEPAPSRSNQAAETPPRGHCLCGAVRFAFDPKAVVSRSLCHCESCRRATGAPVTAWITVRDTGWRWSVGQPEFRASSPGVRRGFCGACGSPLSYATDEHPGHTDLLAGALVDPSTYRPQKHVHWNERLPWLQIEDDLPKHPAA